MADMKLTPFSKIKDVIQGASQWYFGTTERALDHAYKTALMLRALEDEHFLGKRVSPENGNHNESVFDYFEIQLNTYLRTIKTRLREFNASKSFLDSLNLSPGKKKSSLEPEFSTSKGLKEVDRSLTILEKLKFIDETVEPYRSYPAKALVVRDPGKAVSTIATQALASNEFDLKGTIVHSRSVPVDSPSQVPRPVESMFSKSSFLPRSILRTADRMRREIDPRYPRSEGEVVKEFRDARFRTRTSVKFLILLLVIPLITQQVSKQLIISPIVDQFRQQDKAIFFSNAHLKEEAATELQRFAQEIDFEALISNAKAISPEEKAEEIKQRAIELANRYTYQSFDAIKNVFADLLASLSFVFLLIQGREQLKTLRSFIDETVYGLSDSAKAFLIILFTDVFVGFHSTHGWEVLLEGFLKHFGIPENRTVIYTFIATFPVILDTVFKYWIFRYLNQISPSAVATYRNMNE